MAIPEAFLQELKARCDLESVVSRYVNLKKSGRGLMGLCPFHNEKTPSFHVLPEKQFFHCFGCGAGGDVITFIMKIENLSYPDAVRFLAEQTGMRVPEDEADSAAAALARRVLEMNREAAKFYNALLRGPEGDPGRAYFSKRRLLGKTITSFGLGYAPDRWDTLFRYLYGKGFKPEEMRAAALAEQGRGGRWYDKFRNRVMFPIIDVRGAVVGFGGRVLDDSKPKYLNSADTPAFKKSRCLYALNAAKNGSHETLILCEGYMDVIAMHQAGFTNAVATLGTALTEDQARLMARYAKEIIVSYDSDEAGQKAANRAIGILTGVGLRVRVLRIEGGKDPDEFIREHGPEAFKRQLDRSGSDVEYLIAREREKYNISVPTQKVEFLHAATKVLSEVKSPVEREVYASRLGQELGVTKEALLDEADVLRRRSGRSQEQARLRRELSFAQGAGDRVNPDRMRNLKAASAEETLIVLLYNNPSFLQRMDVLIKPGDFITEFNRRVYASLRAQVASGASPDLSLLAAQFTADEIGRVTRLLITRPVSNTMAETADCAAVLRRENELARQKKAISSQEAAADQEPDFQKMFDTIKKIKAEEKSTSNGGE